MILISNLILEVNDGTTIASTEIYGTDKKTYVNIGSGNVLSLNWYFDTLPNDETLDHFKLVIKRYDPTLDVYYNILDKNIGLVNSFYVNSDILPIVPLQYMLSIYVVAYDKQGGAMTSNVVTPYVCKGSGSYVKVQPEGYAGPIMKRALAFAKTARAAMAGATAPIESVVALATNSGELLHTNKEDQIEILVVTDEDPFVPKEQIESELADKNGILLLDASTEEGELLLATTTKLLYNVNGWDIMQESYTKGDDNEWHTSDIKFEVLVAKGTENSYEPIMVRINDDKDNPIYEPLYVL